LSADLPTRVSALSFQIYVSRFIYELEIVPDSESGRPQDAQLAKHINGVPLLESDKRALDRWKSGDVKTIGMRLADEFASRYDLPFWEIEEEAGKMLG
jgi:hypothetical protein